ncbi:gliding motility-associated C-terminal domain-containing protein [uncultured Croceitalea sp.]|uniref:PKD domain-containing protein n=1 Tax=uncultured Croceitalea sp. TaxID=1798908 RepID=UPI003305DF4F
MISLLNRTLYKVLFIFFLVFGFQNIQAQNCSVNAGVEEVYCENISSINLAGSIAGPTVSGSTWTQVGGPSVLIADSSDPTTAVSGLVGGNTYTFRLTAECTIGGIQFQDVNIVVQPVTTADAGTAIQSCPDSSGSLTLNANTPINPGEVGEWSIVGSNTAGVSINDINSPTSFITLPTNRAGTTTLRWTITGPDYEAGQFCESTDTVTIINYGGEPIVNAGSDQTLDNCYTVRQSTILNASFGGNNINGQVGTWSFISGPTNPDFSNPNNNSSVVSNLIEGTYILRWTVTGSCASGVDTITITVPEATQELTTAAVQEDEIRFCDSSITSVTLAGSQPLFTGETTTWTQVSGSSTGISILNPANSTTQVTGLDSNETYVFRYTITNTNTGCTDFDDVTIRYAPNPITIVGNSGNDVFGACGETVAEIPFATTGEGSNTYAIISGPSDSALINPSSFQNTGSSPISLNFDIEGTYSVLLRRAVSGSIQTGCDVATDIVNVTIALTPSNSNAGTDQQLLCNVTSTTITGNEPPTGSSLWSQLSGPSIATISSPYSRSTDIQDLIPGAYVFQYLITGGNVCSPAASDTMMVLVSSDTPVSTDAGPNQNLLCYGAPVQMAADPPPLESLTGTWTVESQPVGSTVIFQDENNPNTLVFGLDESNETYEFRWTVGNPNDLTCPIPGFATVTVTTNDTQGPTTADAGIDQCLSIGTTLINLDGNEPQPGETGTWSVTPSAGVSFTDANQFNTTATITSDDSYSFNWTIDKVGCQSTFDSVEITVGPDATAEAGVNQVDCADTFTMAASSSTGSGLWTLVLGPGGATIADETSPTTDITFQFSGVYTFEWTVNNGSCSTASDQVTLEVGIPPTTASVGADQEVCLTTSTALTGSAFNSDIETGFWSVLPGAPNTPTFTNINDPLTVVSNLVTGSYTFRWTILGSASCPTTFADLQVAVFAPVGIDETLEFCDVTNFLVEATFGATGTWTQTSGPTPGVTINQSPANSNVAEINIVPGNTYEFTFTADYACNADTKTVTVISSAAPSVNPDAGPDQTLCLGDLPIANQTTLAGNLSSGNVTSSEWRFSEVPLGSLATIDDPTNPTSTLSNLSIPGTYILEWNFAAGNCSDTSDIVRIEVSEAPTPSDAGLDQPNACQLDVQLNANSPTAGIGTWSFDTDPSGGAAIIDSPNSPTSTLSNLTVTGTYVLTWTIENPNTSFTSPSACAPSTDTVSITFSAPAPSEADAGSDQEFCDATATTLGATPLVTGTGSWAQTAGPGVDDASPAAIIADINNPATGISDLQPGTYEFTWTVTNGGCTLTDTMTVDIVAQPVTANAGPDQQLNRFESANLNAEIPIIGTGVWTQISGPTTAGFVDNTNPNTLLLGTVEGIYVFQWTVTNGPICTQESDTVEISFVGVDMELTKTVLPTIANIGDTVTFTITLFNNDGSSTSDATGVAVRDVVPDGFTLVPGTISNDGIYNPGNLTIDWTNLEIANGATLELTFDVIVNSSGSYDNSAQIVAGDIIDIDSSFDNNLAAEDDQDNAEVTIRTADVRLRKTVSPSTASVGETVTFSLRARNNGPDTATGVSIKDVLPLGYTIQTINNGGILNGNEIEWNGLTVATGSGTTVTYTATVNAPTGSSNEYLNTAEISANEVLDPDSTPNNDDGDQSEDDEDSASITLEQVDLELDISNTPTSGNSGDNVTYTVELFNNDTVQTGDATGVEVVVNVPSGFTIVTGSISNGGVYNIGSGTIMWSNVSIANGDTESFTYNLTVNTTGNFDTTGEITASDLPDVDSTPNNDDGDQSEDDEDNTTFNLQSADLSLVKSVSPTTVSVGETVIFTLQVSNTGTSDATGVSISDVVPDGYTIGTINNGGTRIGNEITWSGLTIANGGSNSVSFEATVNTPSGETGEYNNTAEITASDVADPDSSPNNDDGDQSEDDESTTSITLESADLELVKSASASSGNVGDVLTFTITLSNNGTGDATGVTIVDTLPNGFDIVGGSISNGGFYNPGSLTITWDNLSVTNGSTQDITYDVTVNGNGNYTNTAEIIQSDTPDPDSTPNNDDGDQSEDDEASTTFTIQSADLSLVKDINVASSATPNVGDTVVFELTVTNGGPTTATNIVIEDEVPSGYTLGTINNGGISIAGTFLSWDIASLPIGSTTLSYEVTVNAPSGDTHEYMNIAEVTASDQTDPDSEPFNDDGDQDEDDEDFFEIIPQTIDLELGINVSDSNPNVGNTVSFTIELSNLGNTAATDVAIEDLIPTGFGNISGISNGGSFSGGVVNWSGLTVPIGSNTLILTFNAEVLPPNGGTNEYVHIAQVTSDSQFDVDSTPNNDDGDQNEDDEASVEVIPQQADLSIVKTSNVSTPNVGDTVLFTLEISNAGPDVATGVSVEDELPIGYTLINVNNGGTASSNRALWTGLSVLANNGSIALTYEATVNAPTGALNEYLNNAQITASDQFDPDSNPSSGNTVDEDGNGQGDDDDEDSLEVIPAIGDLSLTKIVVDNDINPQIGSEISFEITVRNDGPNDADNVVVQDILPSGFDFVLYSATSGIYNESAGIWQVGDVTNGDTETLVIDVVVNPSGDYDNIAEVIATDVFDVDSTPNNNILAEDDQDNVVVTPVSVIDLALTKSVDNETPDVDTSITFTLEVTNEGPSEATNVQVNDFLPSGFSYVSDNGGGSYSSATGIWNIGNLASNNSSTLNIVVNVNTSGDYTNTAEIISHNELDIDSSPSNDILSEDDQDEVIVIPRKLVDISVSKSADDLTPNIGGQIAFTVTVTNEGPSDATNIVVTDLLESGYEFINAIPSIGVYEPLNGSWTIGDLANGTTETIIMNATVLANGTYTNTAELTDLNEIDSDSEVANNDDTEDDQETIRPEPVLVSDIALNKTVDIPNPFVGDEVIFTISLTNNGPSDASGVSVQDLLPSGYTYVSNNGTAGLYNNSTGLWSLNGTLPNGTTETLNILAIVNPTGNYTNIAEVITSDNSDPDSTPNNDIISEDDMASAEVTAIPLADLSLSKTVDNQFPDVSDTVTFTLTLNNAGPSEATGIEILEALPSGYSYVSDDSGGTYDINTGIWTIPSLNADDTVSLNISVGINTTGSYTNVAEVITVNEQDPNSTFGNGILEEDDQDEQTTQPRVITDISVVKTANNLNPSVGSNITFTVTVSNDGPSDASGLVIEDILASGYDFVNATTTLGTYDEIIGSWSIATLLNGTSETLEITATVLANGEYANTAELIALNTFDPDSSPDNNLNSEDDQDTVNPIPTGLADLSITKSVDVVNPNIGDVIEFTINLTNSGNSIATGVVVTDLMPIGFTYESHFTTAGIYNETTGIWNTNGSIPNGTTETLIVLAMVNPPTGREDEYINRAEITASDQADPDSDASSNDTIDDLNDGLIDDDEASITVEPQSTDISLQKTVNNPRPSIGSEITFTITLTNIGSGRATNIGIEELLPRGYRFISANASVGDFDVQENFWEIAVLETSESATLELVVEVLETDDYLNIVQLAFVDQYDADISNNIAQVGIEPSCLIFYNEFSPNGDGVNETFKIDCISRYPNNVLKVFNRWGNLVFEQQGYNNEWNGISSGRATLSKEDFLPVGTYFYILDLGDGSPPISDWLYINR